VAIDPSIPLAVRPPQFANPLETWNALTQIQMQRENARALDEQRRTMAAERTQQTDKLQRENAARVAFGQALQQGHGVREASRQAALTLNPDALPAVDAYFDSVEKNAADITKLKAETQEKQNALNNVYLDHIGHAADFALTYAKGDPNRLLDAIHMTAADYAQRFPDEAPRAQQALQQLTALSPEQQIGALQRMRASAPYYQSQQAELMKPQKLAPQEQIVVPGQTTATGAPQVLAQNTAVSTDGQLDARFEALRQKQLLGQPLSADEKAQVQAYVERKSVGPEAAAALATNRQTRTIEAQIAAQNRSQSFIEKQAGRKELQEKVEQPYLDAREKADTLRNVIAAARNGNMVAGSVQSLLGTLGLVTMEGVKRINTTELESVQGAGSLVERIKSQAGKLVAGQPMSAKLQSDLEDLTGILESAATKKYQNGWKATTKRYGLDDEQSLVPMTASAAGKADPGGIR
jgi:hypothetical protein